MSCRLDRASSIARSPLALSGRRTSGFSCVTDCRWKHGDDCEHPGECDDYPIGAITCGRPKYAGGSNRQPDRGWHKPRLEEEVAEPGSDQIGEPDPVATDQGGECEADDGDKTAGEDNAARVLGDQQHSQKVERPNPP